MKILHAAICLSLVLVFGSCKQETTFTKYVDNKTDVALTVTLAGYDSKNYNTVQVVAAGEKVSVVIESKEGAETTVPSCVSATDSLVITYSSDTATHTIAKSTTDASNWVFNQSKKGSSKVNNFCTFVVNQEDL